MGYHGKKEYTLLKTIGSGGQGKVVLIEEERTRLLDATASPIEEIPEDADQVRHIVKWKDECALKFVYINDLDQINKGFQEYSNVKQLNHTNVAEYDKVYLHEIEQLDTTFMHIKMPYYRNGDLKDFLKRYREITGETNLPPHMIFAIMKQIVMGVQYLHQNKILHRDLKPMNIFVYNKNTEIIDGEEVVELMEGEKVLKQLYRKRHIEKEALFEEGEFLKMKDPNYDFEHIELKLGDFGLSTIFSDKESMKTTQCGSPFYMAPEMFYGCYTVAVDYFAIGAILLNLMSQEEVITPTLRRNDYAHFQQKVREKGYSNALIQLMVQLLQDDPKKRPNCQTILNRLENIEMRGDTSPSPQTKKVLDDSLFENDSYDSDSSSPNNDDLFQESKRQTSPMPAYNQKQQYYFDDDSLEDIQSAIQSIPKPKRKQPRKTSLDSPEDLDQFLEMQESSSSYSNISPVSTRQRSLNNSMTSTNSANAYISNSEVYEPPPASFTPQRSKGASPKRARSKKKARKVEQVPPNAPYNNPFVYEQQANHTQTRWNSQQRLQKQQYQQAQQLYQQPQQAQQQYQQPHQQQYQPQQQYQQQAQQARKQQRPYYVAPQSQNSLMDESLLPSKATRFPSKSAPLPDSSNKIRSKSKKNTSKKQSFLSWFGK